MPSAVQSFSYTGGVQSFTVPVDVSSLTVTLNGASGGDCGNAIGGAGGSITSTITVTPGETLNIYVGGQGNTTAGGFNGGGNPFLLSATGGDCGGGGATDIRRAPYTLADRLVVAGAGGGAYGPWSAVGGTGGYPSGGGGSSGGGAQPPGAGGTASAGGANGGMIINIVVRPFVFCFLFSPTLIVVEWYFSHECE